MSDNSILPLSLSPEEKRQFSKYCKLNNQTMSARLRELIRKDMGFTLLSHYKEKYQRDVIDHVTNNKLSLIVKSRQMYMTTMLLSILLEHMIEDEGSGSYHFFSPNKESMKHAVDKFLLQCSDNNIDLSIQNRNAYFTRMTLYNGANVEFSQMCHPNDMGSSRMIIVDEAAFIPKGDLTLALSSLLMADKLAIASTPNEDSCFNHMAKKVFAGKSEFSPLISHWSMNSYYCDRASSLSEIDADGHVRFSPVLKDVRNALGESDAKLIYEQAFECLIL